MAGLVSNCAPSEKSDSSSQSSASTYGELTRTVTPVANMFIFYQMPSRPLHPPFPSTLATQVLTVTYLLNLIGSIGLAGTLLAVCMWRARRRRTSRKAYDDDPRASSPSSRTFNRIRRHSPVEEDGPELMDGMMNEKGTNAHKEMENLRAEEADTVSAVNAFGLGVGMVGRGFPTISSRISGSWWDSRPYSELTDYPPNDAQDMPILPLPPARWEKVFV